MNIEKLLCDSKKEIKDALELININGKGIVFITKEDRKLCGIITDGDIRRALLKGASLNDCVADYMNEDYTYADNREKIEEVLERINYAAKIVPVINNQGKVERYYEFRNDIYIPVSQPQLRNNELKYLTDALVSTWISSTGKYILEFESEFSKYCDTKYGVAVSNGTAALHLALVVLGIGKGDEVIVPDITFAATINAVLYTGATPVIVDVEKDSWCIDSYEILKALTKRTKAIIPVHLYGQPCDMESIMHIAREHHLFVIEDCAEAHGATYAGKKVGSFGDIGCFSFFGNKVITTGEGGMCVTNCADLQNKMKLYRDHGMSKTYKYYHEVIGFNYRMTNMQAAIGVAQLEKIEEILNERKRLEEDYRRIFGNELNIQWQADSLANRQRIVWLVSALVPSNDRDLLIKTLKKRNIDARPFFIPLSQMKIYEKYTFSNKNSKVISKKGINLPTIATMECEDIETIKDVFLILCRKESEYQKNEV